jgi:hypothetical protein
MVAKQSGECIRGRAAESTSAVMGCRRLGAGVGAVPVWYHGHGMDRRDGDWRGQRKARAWWHGIGIGMHGAYDSCSPVWSSRVDATHISSTGLPEKTRRRIRWVMMSTTDTNTNTNAVRVVISCCLYVRFGCSFTSLDVLTHSRTGRHGKAAHAAAHRRPLHLCCGRPGGATRRVEESSGFPVPAARGRYNTTTTNYDAASSTCFPGRSSNAVDVRARVVISLQLQCE